MNMCRSANQPPQGTSGAGYHWLHKFKKVCVFSEGGAWLCRASVKKHWAPEAGHGSVLPTPTRIRPEEDSRWLVQLGFGWPVRIYGWRLTCPGGHLISALCHPRPSTPLQPPAPFYTKRKEIAWRQGSSVSLAL